MRRFGYEMLSREKDGTGVIFRLMNAEHFDGLEPFVTILPPDCVTTDGTPAYEKNYVIDLVKEIMGEHGEKAIFTLLAERHMDS
jgi:hypothetical protein